MRPLNNFINEKLQISRNTKRYIDYVAELKAQNKFAVVSIAYWKKYLGVDPTVIDYSVSKRAAAIIDLFGRNNQIEHLFDYLASEGPIKLTESEFIKKVAYVDIPDFEYYNGELNAEPAEINEICKIHEKLQISRSKKIEYPFDTIKPIKTNEYNVIEELYNALDAWIYRYKESDSYDLLKIYGVESNLPVTDDDLILISLSIDKTRFSIICNFKDINTGTIEKIDNYGVSIITRLLGKGDKEKGYGVINYIIEDIDA
jgi:hypothetical protein